MTAEQILFQMMEPNAGNRRELLALLALLAGQVYFLQDRLRPDEMHQILEVGRGIYAAAYDELLMEAKRASQETV